MDPFGRDGFVGCSARSLTRKFEDRMGEFLRPSSYEDLVQLNFYVTSRDDYATARRAFGKVWKELCGRHYPAMAMFMVVSLFDPDARIEIQGIAAQ